MTKDHGRSDTGRPTDSELSHEELVRYSRHLVLPDVGLEGQRRLKASSVLLVGAGGLGSPAALYLAAAGVGTIGLVDFDTVDVTNLHRQVLYGQAAVGRSKLAVARERLEDLNPHIQIEAFEARLTSDNALDIIRDCYIVVDGTDNFPTRYLVNDACVLSGKPNVYGAIFRFEGQVAVFDGRSGPCYRCLYPEPPPPGLVPSCAEGGVLGVLPGIVGSLQALEAIKLIVGCGEPLLGRLLVVDTLTTRFVTLSLEKDARCPVCGADPSIRTLIDYEAFCGHGAVEGDGEGAEVDPRELAEMLETEDAVTLLDVREPYEWRIAPFTDAATIPLGELPGRLREIDSDREVVTICHHGRRSLQARAILRAGGFQRVRSLRGGIEAWSLEVDPTIARY